MKTDKGCLYCGSIFIAEREHQKYCSQECRTLDISEQRKSLSKRKNKDNKLEDFRVDKFEDIEQYEEQEN